jgi:hypothetical protein
MLATALMTLANNIGTLLLPFLFAGSLLAQTPSQASSCSIVANVRDPHGAFVKDLSGLTFRGKSEGKPIDIKLSPVNLEKRRVVLLLDVSGSLAFSSHTWKTEKMVASDFLRSAAMPGRTAMVLFASDIVKTFDFNHSPAEMTETLERFSDASKVAGKGRHSTALIDAVLYGLTLLGSPQPGDVIYAVTDGGDNFSHHTQREMEEGLLKGGVRFFSFFLTDSNSPTEEQRVGPSRLRDLALLSGGATLDIPDSNGSILYDLSPKGKAQMAAGLFYLYDLMGNFYELQLDQLPASGKKSLELELLNESGRRVKDFTLMYPQRANPCRTDTTEKRLDSGR